MQQFFISYYHHSASQFPIYTQKYPDGQTLPINRRQKAYNNGTLVIEQLQRMEDAGTYTCEAQNKLKQTSRRNVEIQVLSKFKSMFVYQNNASTRVAHVFVLLLLFLLLVFLFHFFISIHCTALHCIASYCPCNLKMFYTSFLKCFLCIV